MAARPKAWVCGRSLAGTEDSNSPGSMDVCLLLVLCVIRERSLRRSDHPSKEFLPRVVCLSVIEEPQRGGLGPHQAEGGIFV